MRYFFLLILLLPIQLVAQGSFAIDELKTRWEHDSTRIKSDSVSFCFVMSNTDADPGYVFGYFWQTGTPVMLPKNALGQKIILEKLTEGFVLTWFEETSKGVFLVHFEEIYLPLNIDLGNSPREMKILLKPPD